jgi:hypothetical protein
VVSCANHKSWRAAHPALRLTGMYNALEKLKSGEALRAKGKAIHDNGLVAALKSLHDPLDHEVLGAFGWADLIPLMDVANRLAGT